MLRAGWGGAVLLLSGSALLTGCTSAGPTPARTVTPPPTPAPDEVLRRRAVAQVEALQTALAQLSTQPALAGRLALLEPGYRRQLSLLGAGSPAVAADHSGGGTPSAVRSSGATPSATAGTAAPVTPPAALNAIVAAAAQALGDAETAAAAGLAVLLARLAAAHAVEADLLASVAGLPSPAVITPRPGRATPTDAGSRSPSATPTPGSGSRSPSATPTPGSGYRSPSATPTVDSAATAALNDLLAGEHAAIYAYGVITAWVSSPLRTRAQACWAAHTVSRDTLIQLLRVSGATPVAASPAYHLGTRPAGSAAAVALAGTVEGRLAALAASTVGAVSGTARGIAAGVLVAAARRQNSWTPIAGTLPGGP